MDSMSHRDDIEESLESFFDMMENCLNDSLRTSTPTCCEDVGGTDDTVATPEAVDPHNRALDETSHPPKARTVVEIGQDFSGNPCEISYSETLSSDSLVPAANLPPWLQRRPGIWGFICDIPGNMSVARTKGYLLPFELICFGFAVMCCFKGAHYWPVCPANANIPRYVFINGGLGAFAAGIEVMDTLWKLAFYWNRDMRRYFCAFGIGWVAVITTLIEMTEFYTMSCSFYKYEKNYCNEEFYWFVYYKNIVFGVLMSLAALLYIPSHDYRYYYSEYYFI